MKIEDTMAGIVLQEEERKISGLITRGPKRSLGAQVNYKWVRKKKEKAKLGRIQIFEKKEQKPD